jgi:hypothetical protein
MCPSFGVAGLVDVLCAAAILSENLEVLNTEGFQNQNDFGFLDECGKDSTFCDG